MRIDFSQYHPSDHLIFSKRCRSLYGGWKRHIWVAWTFGPYKHQLKAPLYKILCPLGRHHVLVWYSKKSADDPWVPRPSCEFCDYTRIATEEELFGRDSIPDFSNAEIVGLPEEDNDED